MYELNERNQLIAATIRLEVTDQNKNFLKDRYEALPRLLSKELKDTVMELTQWSESVWGNKVSNRTPLVQLEIELIDRIFKDIIEKCKYEPV